MPTMSEEAGASALAAERAAGAAESAAEAAGRAAGAMENMGEWMARLASQSGSPALAGAEAAEMQARIGKGGPGVIKRGVIAIGQRVSELSDGRYGLSVQPEGKARNKSAENQLARHKRQLARAASTEAKAAWFPWMLGLSLGLVIGMIGVAYWQRRRLQRFWGQTSQRAQHATEGLRQRLDASRSARPPGAPSEAAMGRVPEPVDYTPPGSPRADMTIDQQVNGRVESASQ